MVPFQRPSMTESMASMGQGEISFFETGMGGLGWLLVASLTHLSVHLVASV